MSQEYNLKEELTKKALQMLHVEDVWKKIWQFECLVIEKLFFYRKISKLIF